MKVEYLIIVKQEDSFCNTEEAFVNLLNVDSSIEIAGNAIRHTTGEGKAGLSADYTVGTSTIPSKGERCFHLVLNSTEEGVEEDFANLTETVKDIVKRINPESTRINTLWDDIGRQYAIQAYPMINEVENLMRKLISKFMLVNVGMDWSRKAVHSDILSKIENRNQEQDLYLDDLYQYLRH